MIEITQYQAFDGTVFDDEGQCLEYEKSKKKESAGFLVMLDSRGIKVDSPVVATYVALDRRSIDYFNWLCNVEGCCPLEVPDVLKLFKSESDISCFCFDDVSNPWDVEWKSLDVLEKFVNRAFTLLKQYMPLHVDAIDC